MLIGLQNITGLKIEKKINLQMDCKNGWAWTNGPENTISFILPVCLFQEIRFHVLFKSDEYDEYTREAI